MYDAWVDMKIYAENEEKMAEVMEAIHNLLLNDSNVSDYIIVDESGI